jgi:hypothetical protein
MKPLVRVLGFVALVSAAGSGALAAERTAIECEMTYTLSGWSAFYKTAKGTGTITCSNGQSAKVTLNVKGGGLTFGKSEIVDGIGNFSDVYDIDELFGAYAAAEAHAGAVKSAQAAVYTKGEVSLAMAGKGRGFDLGIDFGRITIERK